MTRGIRELCAIHASEPASPQPAIYLDEYVFRHNRRDTPMAAFRTLLGLATHHEPTTRRDIIDTPTCLGGLLDLKYREYEDTNGGWSNGDSPLTGIGDPVSISISDRKPDAYNAGTIGIFKPIGATMVVAGAGSRLVRGS